MTARPDRPARSAERLLRCYPAAWRARYGEEFTQLLIDDISERPRSWARTADVVRSGLLARFTGAGLTGHSLEPQQQVGRPGNARLCARRLPGLRDRDLVAAHDRLAMVSTGRARDRGRNGPHVRRGPRLHRARAAVRDPAGLDGRQSLPSARATRPPATADAHSGGDRGADSRQPPFRAWVARHRRPSVGRPPPRPGRPRPVLLGGDTGDHVVLGASGRSRVVSGV